LIIIIISEYILSNAMKKNTESKKLNIFLYYVVSYS